MCTNLERLIENGKLEGAEVLFITYPLFSEYKKSIDTCQSFITATEYIDKLEDKNQIRHISSENLFCDKKWFFNQDHLNQEGWAIAQDYYINLFYDSTLNEIKNCIDDITKENE